MEIVFLFAVLIAAAWNYIWRISVRIRNTTDEEVVLREVGGRVLCRLAPHSTKRLRFKRHLYFSTELGGKIIKREWLNVSWLAKSADIYVGHDREHAPNEDAYFSTLTVWV